jgi:hypothetical protein
MKASEMIGKLAEMIKENGDLEVCYMCDPYHDNDWYTPIDSIFMVGNPTPHIEGDKKNSHTKHGRIIKLE